MTGDERTMAAPFIYVGHDMFQIAIDDNMPLKHRGQERLHLPTALTSCDGPAWLLTDQGLGGRHWTRTSDLLHVKQVL